MYSLLLLPLLSINIAMNKIKQMNYLIKIEDSFLESETPAVGKKAVVICHVVFLKSYNCSYRTGSCFSPIFPSC